MSDDADPTPPPKKSLKLPLMLGLVLAMIGGAAGFLEVRAGTVSSLVTGAGGEEDHGEEHAPIPPLGAVAFIPLEPIVINLPPGFEERHLSFSASLEVAPEAAADVTALVPRVVDIMNTYLRALQPSDFEDPALLTQIRSQMLRRVQLVTGEGRVRDVLIAEFVLN